MSAGKTQGATTTASEAAGQREPSPARLLKLALKRGIRRNGETRYPIERSPLWRLHSPHQLARLLRLPLPRLLALETPGHYRQFQARTAGKTRLVDEPLGIRLRVHYRLARLLDRIERAPYLQSATPGRSHVSNAKFHASTAYGHRVAATDIVKFYPSTSPAMVKRFFIDALHWPHDMARLMAKVCTVNGHLPLGSCVSPLLSYLVHKPAFDAVAERCAARNLRFTVFIDNLTLSGPAATQSMLHEIKQVLHRHGLRSHDDCLTPPGGRALITGAVLDGDRLQLPAAARLRIVQGIRRIAAGQSATEDIQSVQGQIGAASAVDDATARNLQRRLSQALKKQDTAQVTPQSC